MKKNKIVIVFLIISLNVSYTFSQTKNINVENPIEYFNQRNEAVSLVKNDYFIGTKGSFQEVLFFRNKLGKIVNFKVSSSRAKDVQFDKIM
jgi:hypothetical protein